MERAFLKSLLEQVNRGQKSVDALVDFLLQEMGRGGRILVVDENILDLEPELLELGYTVDTVDLGGPDEAIKKQLKNRVLVTRNGRHFVDDVADFRYGVIWVVSKGDAKTLARKVERAMMTSNFHRKPAQVVKV